MCRGISNLESSPPPVLFLYQFKIKPQFLGELMQEVNAEPRAALKLNIAQRLILVATDARRSCVPPASEWLVGLCWDFLVYIAFGWFI